MASGAGWAWLRNAAGVVHVAGARGPRGPLTALVERVPVVEAGDTLRLDAEHAVVWRTPASPEAASASAIAAACEAVRPHMWNDPRALQLSAANIYEVARDLAGRGPGLTPAGDDALAGFVYACVATGHVQAQAARDAAHAAMAVTGEPSRSLLNAAAQGEVFAPAAQMLHTLLRADGRALAPAVRTLAALGRTTGRALLTGIVCALTPAG
jgi:Protein of unknown function (DUF2877)